MSHLLFNSLLIAMACTALSGVMGICAALACVGNRKAAGAVSILAVVAFCSPSFMITNVWLHFFGSTPSTVKYSIFGAVLILSASLWPVFFGSIYLMIRRLEWQIIDVVPELRGWKLFVAFIWPQARAAILIAAVVCFSLAAANMSVPATLQIQTLLVKSWMAFNTTYDLKGGLVVLMPLIAIGLAAGFFAAKYPVSPSRESRQSAPSKLSGIIFALWIVLTLMLPWVHVLTSLAYRVPAQTLSASVPALFQTLMFACAVGMLSLFGIFAKSRLSRFMLWTFFLIPGVALGIMAAWGSSLLLIPPFVALVVCAVKYLVIPSEFMRIARAQIPRAVLDVAAVNARKPISILFRANFKAPLFGGFFLVYLLSLWEVETLLFVVPPGFETLSLRAFNFLHYGYTADVNVYCLLIVGVGLIPLLAWRMSKGLFLIPLLLMGCVEDESDVQSKIFDRVEVIGRRGSGAGELSKPRSVAVDFEDILYVADMSGRVQKFSPAGEFLLQWQLPQTDLGKPKGMGVDKRGNIIVIEPHYARINHFDPAGKLVAQWGGASNQVVFPRSIFAAPNGYWISEYGKVERLQFFSQQFQPLIILSNSFNRVEGIALDQRGQLYVADSCNHVVKVFSPSGEFITQFGKAGSAIGELSYPYDVRVDEANRIYVCEYGNSRVQIFNASFQPLEILGRAGGARGQMSNPWAITLDSQGNLYVADGGNHRVQKFIRSKQPEGRNS